LLFSNFSVSQLIRAAIERRWNRYFHRTLQQDECTMTINVRSPDFIKPNTLALI